MAKVRFSYVCQECGALSAQWAGQCTSCAAWNTLQALADTAPRSGRQRTQQQGFSGVLSPVHTLENVPFSEEQRRSSGMTELDRVLGGGLVEGSVVLIGGDPGIGKSTLLLQSMTHLALQEKALYITGEESLAQVAMRARRLELPLGQLQVMAEVSVEAILEVAQQHKPTVMVIDSIQTVFTEQVQAAAGGVSQLRESTALLTRFAKQQGVSLILVGHVTKEGALAGPRVLEHMVDAVLYFEGEQDSRYRMIRAVKNRFGAVNELGIFAMTDRGLKEVANPSAIFLSRFPVPIAGSLVMVTREGSRPLLVEIQALVDQSGGNGTLRRVAVGLDANRLGMLLAVLHRHAGVSCAGQDVFINAVGGVKVVETGADLAVLLAVVSSLKGRALAHDLIVFGEVGLSGEIRPVANGQERLREARKHGFTRAIVPKANAPRSPIAGLEILPVMTLQEALGQI